VSPGQEDLVRAVADVGVRDERVLDAFRRVPRAGFVPAELVGDAYVDQPLPIPHLQVTTQPSLVAKMIEALRLEPTDAALEIGTGFGFQTALLAQLCARVYSIERFDDIAAQARAHLDAFGVTNVEVIVGDGSAGLPEHAPYEAILVSAAYPRVPPPIAEQLSEGGRLVQPIGPGGSDDVKLFEKAEGRLINRGTVIGAHFVRLYGEHGFRE
jgi:protein-L-isoaspartate(D-aspartate) O-methyltransferase